MLARGALCAGVGLYRPVVALRNALYDLGLRAVGSAGAKVISVGNLTTGGTGKTPMVEWLACWLRERGYRPAVLARGYGNSGPGSTHEGPRPAAGLNDEGLLLQANVPGLHVIVGADRLRSAQTALREIEPPPDCFVLDDAFQHRRIDRDLNILLIDSLNPFGFGHLLPRGLLREPVRSLRRADLIVLTRADQAEEPAVTMLARQIHQIAPEMPILTAAHRVKGILQRKDLSPVGDGWVKGKRLFAFCGIGNPEGFRKALAGLEATITGFREYPDHYWYREDDVHAISAEAERLGAEAVITTQKDAVRLSEEAEWRLPLLCLRVGIEFLTGESRLTDRLADLFPKDNTASDPET